MLSLVDERGRPSDGSLRLSDVYGMLKEKQSPAEALRAAKAAMLRQPRWRSPYYRAAFELQGDWR